MESAKTVRRRRAAQESWIKSGVRQAVYFGCGLLASRGAVLGTLAPFGASYAAAVPREGLLASLLGATMGYIILSPTDSFRYIAVMMAIGGVRWLFSDLGNLTRSRLFAPLAVFVPIIATGIALLFGSTSTVSEFTACLLEGLLAAAAAYFMSVSVRMVDDRRSVIACTGQETACLVMTGCVLILSLGALEIEGVSVGRILAVVVVLLCARYGGVQGGAVSGIATGAVFSLANFQQGFLCGAYAFGGLMAGLFSGLRKIGCAAVFAVTSVMMSMAFGSGILPVSVMLECAVATAIFLFVPRDAANIITPIFVREPSANLGETVKNSVVMRLAAAARAIRNVRGDIENVSKRLDEIYAPRFETVCDNVAKDVCAGCGLKMYCYEHEGGVTRDDFFRLEEVLSEKGTLDENSVAQVFVKNCCKKGEIAEAMTKHYRLLTAGREAERRIAEIRGAVAGQFAGVSDLLADLSHEFEDALRCDSASADRITEALAGLGAIPEKVVCLVGENGRMRAELALSAKGEPIREGQMRREVSRACGRCFDLPTVTEEGGVIRAALCELPMYDVEIGSDQHIARGGKLCGDCIDYFNDGTGKTCALVCDGMGTGGRAAVDGNMAVSAMGRLLRAGLSADSALQIVNTALMIKSEDESLSTVDLALIDLYSGELTLKKAGAAATYIRRGGRVIRREMPSLPAGILNNIKFSTEYLHLSAGDMVVMISDGVVTGDEKWLEQLIRTWRRGSAQELAQAVVEEAIRRRAETKDDDITAVAMRVVENEESQ
ncbi:MAG: SpoIIE family protein phosphatase [Ruminococcus sp.]|nr:SpoIIE family protein phosphatase [Ruminococcus sp.]